MRGRLILLLVLLLGAFSCANPTPPITTPKPVITPTPQLSTPIRPPTPTPFPPTPSTPTPTTAPPHPRARPRAEVIATGLEVVWEVAFSTDGRLFLTERPGRLRLIDQGRLLPEPLAVLPVAAQGEGGLLGLALHPQFPQEPYLYLYYTYPQRDGLRNRVARFTLQGNQALEPLVLLEGIPGNTLHDGGRLRFGPDGKLYITTGDALQPALAQDPASLAGKVLRLNPDGSIPQDNPFPGSPVWSLGHRNPQGLAWHSETGRLFITEHGPVGRDEVNLIQPGANYGWPLVVGRAGKEGLVDPIAEYTPAIAPSGAAFYTGEAFPEWQGDLFFATLRGEHLHRIRLDRTGREVIAQERLFPGEFGRLRSVAQGPHGLLYLTTSNRDGRGEPAPEDDRILRLAPPSPP